MLIELYAIDLRTPTSKGQYYIRGSKDGRAKVHFVRAQDAMVYITECLARQITADDQLVILRIFAHGTSGYVYFGEGLDELSCRFFSRLQSLWHPTRRLIELHSCEVAADYSTGGLENQGYFTTSGRGYRFMCALAAAADAPVRASTKLQMEDKGCNMEWETITVSPDGTWRRP